MLLKKPSTDDLKKNLLEGTYDVKSIMKHKNESHVMKKLVCVLLLAGLFMGIEIAGGILSHSIAILSDAAHMLSDLLGFVISILSVYISGLPANKKHSYGFHRAGIIGALASVMVIWVLTGFLIYFAIKRVMNLAEVEVEGPLMFGVACFGLVTNIIMIKVLHGADGHDHGHGHSHGGHSHGGHSHGGHSHEHSHSHEKGHKHKDGHSHELKNGKKKNQDSSNHSESDNNSYQSLQVNSTEDDDHHEVKSGQTLKKKVSHEDHDHDHEHEHDHHHSDEESGSAPKNLSQPSDKDNMNVRATVIHIFGDILQSIGVIIASTLIWINPNFKIADPIITFIFALIVLYTTLRIVKDCIFVLMEGTPADIDMEHFEEKLKNIEGVAEVHDLHVWSLGVGKPAMSAHIYANQSSEIVLKKATTICRLYGIFHSTIQIETTRDKSNENYFDCNHNIH